MSMGRLLPVECCLTDSPYACREITKDQDLLSDAHTTTRQNSIGDGTHLAMLPPNPLASSPQPNGNHPSSPTPHHLPHSPQPHGAPGTYSPEPQSSVLDLGNYATTHANGYSSHEHWEASQTPFPAMTGLGLGLRGDGPAGALEPAALEFSEAAEPSDELSTAPSAEDVPLDPRAVAMGSQNGPSHGFANVALGPSESPTKQPGKAGLEDTSGNGKLVEVCMPDQSIGDSSIPNPSCEHLLQCLSAAGLHAPGPLLDISCNSA